MADIFDTLLLLALPASGKSETRKYLSEKSPEEFHMGPTVQLDDYPYVHFQIVCDEVINKLGHETVFHRPDSAQQLNGPFRDARELGGLIELLNEDYAELRSGQVERTDSKESSARRMLERLDSASEKAGAAPKFRTMSDDLRTQVEQGVAEAAHKFMAEKAENCPPSLDGKTVVIEFARGGPPGESFPLPEGYGYAGALPHLSEDILKRAAILYIWVTPEESRRKNRARARPDGAGSILFHGTPEIVMEQEYSRCDMAYLIETAKITGTVHVVKNGQAFDVPVSRFDNRKDLTTFLRGDVSEWKDEDCQAIHGVLRAACDPLWESYVKTRGNK